MTKTISITVYAIDELADKAKSKALESISHMLSETFEPLILTDHFAERLRDLDLPFNNIYWDLSCSQRDGVAFYGTFNVASIVRDRIKDPALYASLQEWLGESLDDVYATIEGNERYLTMTVNCDWPSDKGDSPEALDKALTQYVRKVAAELASDGYAWIQDLTDTHAALQYARDNELWFDANGKEV